MVTAMEIEDNPLELYVDPKMELFNIVARAADWVREKYNIDRDCPIVDHFEQEFRCKVIFNDDIFPIVKFNDEDALAWFLMRWT
jgi:hypothetical protein